MLLLIGVCLLLPFSSGNKNKICANIAIMIQAQDNIDSLKGTHFSYTLLTVLSLFVK
jgi:hypothetical protein